MTDSDDFAKVVSSKVRPALQLILVLGAGGAWMVARTWEVADMVMESERTNDKQDELIEQCLAQDAVHMRELAESERRHALALQAIFEQDDLLMDIAMDKLSAKRRKHYWPRVQARRKATLKLIYSIPQVAKVSPR